MTTTRRVGTVSAAALIGLAGTLFTTHLISPKWAQHLGFDVWNMPSLRKNLQASDQRRSSLETVERQLQHDIEACGHVAAQVAEGELTLAAGAEQLEPHMRARDGFECVQANCYRAPTFRHGVARYIIIRIQRMTADQDRWNAIAPQLEAEYAALR